MIWILRTVLLAGWVVMLLFTTRAISALGVDTAGDVFFEDFAHPWRGQFNIDLLLHLGLIGGWIAWREKRILTGVPFAALSILLGGVFTLGYVLACTFTSNGNITHLLVGNKHS